MGGVREKLPARKNPLLQIADFDFVSRRTSHLDWSIYCQSSSVQENHAEKKQISETNNVGEAIERALDFSLNRKIKTLF